MHVELVQTRTRDGVRLDGILQHAETDIPSRPSLDAVICLSGVGSNFYGSSIIEKLAQMFCLDGIAALRVNTRGHDGVSTAATTAGGILQGAAYEIVDDCRHDINAWVNFVVERGYSRVALLGHSLGAVKSVYAQVHESHANVSWVIAISPPCLSYTAFLQGTQATAFQNSMRLAQSYLDQGTPDTLFLATFPYPLVISAATYVDKYGPSERYNLLRWAHRVTCPLLFAFGERELRGDNVAFQDIVERINTLPWKQAAPKISVIPEANHNYSGQGDMLGEAIRAELRAPSTME